MLQIQTSNAQVICELIYIYKVYNASFRNYKIIKKKSLLEIETTLRMLKECVLIENFNLYYFI